MPAVAAKMPGVADNYLIFNILTTSLPSHFRGETYS